jgi:flavin-binding protein dodecin
VAIERASQTLRDLCVARIVEQDVHIEPGKPLTYRVKVEISFKFEGGDREEVEEIISLRAGIL